MGMLKSVVMPFKAIGSARGVMKPITSAAPVKKGLAIAAVATTGAAGYKTVKKEQPDKVNTNSGYQKMLKNNIDNGTMAVENLSDQDYNSMVKKAFLPLAMNAFMLKSSVWDAGKETGNKMKMNTIGQSPTGEKPIKPLHFGVDTARGLQ